MGLTDFLSSFIPTVYADAPEQKEEEKEAPAEEPAEEPAQEEEEEEEPEDVRAFTCLRIHSYNWTCPTIFELYIGLARASRGMQAIL